MSNLIKRHPNCSVLLHRKNAQGMGTPLLKHTHTHTHTHIYAHTHTKHTHSHAHIHPHTHAPKVRIVWHSEVLTTLACVKTCPCFNCGAEYQNTSIQVTRPVHEICSMVQQRVLRNGECCDVEYNLCLSRSCTHTTHTHTHTQHTHTHTHKHIHTHSHTHTHTHTHIHITSVGFLMCVFYTNVQRNPAGLRSV